MKGKVNCYNCGHSWNKSDSSKKDMYVCHMCGKGNVKMENGGWLDDLVPEAQNGIEGTMGGLTDKGFNYNGAWGGTMQMGGSLPGSVGFTYARTQSPAPSNGKYAKKTKASAQNGEEMRFYQEGLDWKPKSISRDGGWLEKFQVGTPDGGIPKVPYWKNKIYRGPSQFDECEGEGCSKQATEDVASLYGADYASLNPQDAWYKRAAVIKSGGEEVYNRSQGDLQSIYGNLRVGDFVSLDRPGSPHAEDPSKVEGYTLADNEGTEHIGYVIGFDPNGTPLIKHGHEGNILSSASSYVQPITDLSLPDLGLNYKVSSIYRANPLLNNDKELNTNYYKDLLPQENLSFYDKDRLTNDKQQFINAYNKNSEKFQRETGLSPEEISAIGNIAYGIFGNESKFNESLYRPIKQLGAEALNALGVRDTPASLGPTQLKYDQVAENKDKSKTRKGKLMRALGVKKNEIDNVFHSTDYDAVTSATFASLAENYKKLTTDPEFGYNPENNTVLGNVPLGKALAKSWQNPSLKNVKESLQKGESDYANAAYRNMSELEGQVFPINLREVVITPEKKNGGWLNKYEEGGVIEDDMGQWAHPGEITKINSNQITMQGVDYPVLGISDTGDTKMMQPGQDYKFKGKSVTEVPMMQGGGEVIKVKQPDGSFKTYNTNSEEYRKLYDSGRIQNYDKETDTYISKPLDEVVITGQAPEKGFFDQSISSFLNENKDAGLLGALSSVVTYPLGLPQQAMMYGLTGKVQDPSEALDIENPYGAFAVNALADPTNLFGIGLADDALRLSSRASKFFSKGRMNQGVPKASLLGDLKESFRDLKSIGEETYGYLKNDKANKKAIAEGNQWLQNWIQHPATQAKIEKDLGYIKNRPNIVKDIQDLGYEQAKTFTPISKEYPISRQLNEGAIHSDNSGVSYMHGYDPYDRSNSYFKSPRYGSWISRTPKMSYDKRASTTIHEGTHDWTSDFLLNESGQKNYLLSELDPKLRADWKLWKQDPKAFEQYMGRDNSYKTYMADPTEQHARTMELRKYFNLAPDQMITPEDAQNMIYKLNILPREKQPIDASEFLNTINNDPKKLSSMFNRLWSASPYVAPIAGAASMATQKEQKNGGWLNKYK